MRQIARCLVVVVILFSVFTPARAFEWGTTYREYAATIRGRLGSEANMLYGFDLQTEPVISPAGVKSRYQDHFTVNDGWKDEYNAYAGKEVVVSGVITETIEHGMRTRLEIAVSSVVLSKAEKAKDAAAAAEKLRGRLDNLELRLKAARTGVEGLLDVFPDRIAISGEENTSGLRQEILNVAFGSSTLFPQGLEFVKSKSGERVRMVVFYSVERTKYTDGLASRIVVTPLD